MKLKNWLNRSFPSIVGLDHISYKLNPIDKWFEFYFSAKKKGLLPIGQLIMVGLLGCITKILMGT